MKKWFLLILIICVIAYAAYTRYSEQPDTREESLNQFILTELSSPNGGIYTNYLATDKQEEWATGHEILSESIGLMMLAAYYEEDKSLFDMYDSYLNKFMILDTGVYAWRIMEETPDDRPSNATIDDLRIGKAYYLAYLKWGNILYLEQAQIISNSLIEHAVIEEILRNYNDGDAFVDLSYLDIHTMTLYASFDNRWQPVKRRAIEIIESGYIGDEFPFYHKVYHTDRASYVQADGVNMIDALLVVLHLSEEGRVKDETIQWLKNQLEEDTVFGWYQAGEWYPIGYIESTAVYAIIMRIADNMDDEVLYELAQFKAVAFQVTNNQSPLYGAFAFEEALEVFSFDQLQMLLALRRG